MKRADHLFIRSPPAVVPCSFVLAYLAPSCLHSATLLPHVLTCLRTLLFTCLHSLVHLPAHSLICLPAHSRVHLPALPRAVCSLFCLPAHSLFFFCLHPHSFLDISAHSLDGTPLLSPFPSPLSSPFLSPLPSPLRADPGFISPPRVQIMEGNEEVSGRRVGVNCSEVGSNTRLMTRHNTAAPFCAPRVPLALVSGVTGMGAERHLRWNPKRCQAGVSQPRPLCLPACLPLPQLVGLVMQRQPLVSPAVPVPRSCQFGSTSHVTSSV